MRGVLRPGVRQSLQANQFLIADHHHAALIDPGGPLVYERLFMQVNDRIFTREELDFIIASHQDPDIISSLNQWLVGSNAKVVVPSLWERFIDWIEHLNCGLDLMGESNYRAP